MSAKGFTLIEMMIVTSLTMILFVYGTIKVRDSINRRNIDKATEQVRLMLEDAKADAFYGRKPSVCVNDKLQGIRVDFDSNDSTVSIQANCGTFREYKTQNIEGGLVSRYDLNFDFSIGTGAGPNMDNYLRLNGTNKSQISKDTNGKISVTIL